MLARFRHKKDCYPGWWIRILSCISIYICTYWIQGGMISYVAYQTLDFLQCYLQVTSWPLIVQDWTNDSQSLKKKKLDLGLDQGCQKYLDGLRNLMRKISNKCKFQKIHRISKKELFICSMSTLFCANQKTAWCTSTNNPFTVCHFSVLFGEALARLVGG